MKRSVLFPLMLGMFLAGYGQMDSLSTSIPLTKLSKRTFTWEGTGPTAVVPAATWNTATVEVVGNRYHLNPHGNLLYLSQDEGQIIAFKRGKRIYLESEVYLLKHGKLYTENEDLLARTNLRVRLTEANVEVIAEKNLKPELWAFLLAQGIWEARDEMESGWLMVVPVL